VTSEGIDAAEGGKKPPADAGIREGPGKAQVMLCRAPKLAGRPDSGGFRKSDSEHEGGSRRAHLDSPVPLARFGRKKRRRLDEDVRPPRGLQLHEKLGSEQLACILSFTCDV